MKKILLVIALISIYAMKTQAQGCVLTEDFETNDSTTVVKPTWADNTTLFVSGAHSVHGTYANADSATLSTIPVDLTGLTFVKLRFWHICKIEFFDDAIVEVSADNGVTWTRLTIAEYLGSSGNFGTGNKFTEASYSTWLPGQSVVPDNTWWKYEEFDISALVGNSTAALVRFNVKDKTNNGLNNRYGWVLDDICIQAAPCELIPPVILPITIYPAVVYNAGPFNVTADVTDQSGILAVNLNYTINGSAPTTVSMANQGGNIYGGVIPAVNIGDTICYSIEAIDFTVCGGNFAYWPGPTITDYACFRTKAGIIFPYCDNFDIDSLWTDSTITGSSWELGTPAFGVTNNAYSAPNSWDIDLANAYTTGTEAYLVSPVFNFGGAYNAELDFWINYNTESFADGTRIQYSIDNGTTWQDFQLNGTEVNWYDNWMGSCNCPGWNGNSNGWKHVQRVLTESDLQNQFNPVRIRFVFTSDQFQSFTSDGVSIDNFCLKLPPAIDLATLKIESPPGAVPAGNSVPVDVWIINKGLQAVSNFDVYYSDGGAPQGPFAYSGNLQPNDSALVNCGNYTVNSGTVNFCAWPAIANDGKTWNDTLCKDVTGVPTVTLTYCDNFDGNNVWTAIPSPNGASLWELGTPNFGATNSAHSPPNAWDIDLNSGYLGNTETYLVSPFFDMTLAINGELSFWHNRNCESNWDGTRVDYTTDGGTTWNVLGTVNDPNATNWYTISALISSNLPGWDGNSGGWVFSSYNMNQFNGTPALQIRFCFTSDGAVNLDGYSIDDFCFTQPLPDDVTVVRVDQPGTFAPIGNVSPVEVVIKNVGTNTQTSIDVGYSYNGITNPNVTWTGTLAPNQTASVTLLPNVSVVAGTNPLCAYTALAIDQNTSNDTLCKPVTGLSTFIPTYCDNFDGVSEWLPITQSTTAWELGTPNFGQTNSAHSPPNAWDVNLNNTYGQGDTAYLLSPFFDMSTSQNATLQFWQNRNSQQFSDGTRIDYTINGGATWNILGNFGGGVNWYNQTFLNSSFQAGWDGSSGGWIKSEWNMSAFNNTPNIQFRFVFTSDNFVGFGEDGFSFDDFCLRVPPPIDAGLESIDQPASGAPANTSVGVTVTLRNYGSTVLTSVPITYVFLGNPTTTTWTGSLSPNATTSVVLNGTITLPVGQNSLCAYTGVANDGDALNDTVCKNIVGIPTLIPTYTDDFDGGTNYWTTSTVNPSTVWELGTPNFGQTSSTHSAPNSWDVNLNTGYQPNAECYLYSPYFDFTNAAQAEIRMWINYNTEGSWDGCRVDYTTNGSLWNVVGAMGQGTNWYNFSSLFSSSLPGWAGTSGGWQLATSPTLTMLDYSPNPVQFRIPFTADGAVNFDGFSVDDFQLYVPIQISAASTNIKPNNNILVPGTQFIKGRITNKGTTKLNYCFATLAIDGTTIVTDSVYFVNPLKLDSSAWHVFSLPWNNASPGAHTLCMYTSLPNGQNDLNNLDDTTCSVYTVFDSTSVYPYCNDFESGPVWPQLNAYTYASPTSWQLGNPAKPNVNGTHSGVNAWVTKLSGNYSSPDSSALFAPVLNVQGGKCYKVKFWHNFYTEQWQDGGTLEYSADSGVTWKALGLHIDPNWFNTYFITAFNGPPPTPGWTGNSNGWIESSREFPSWFTGGLMLRFRFGSDITVNSEGWAIDDFCFEELPGPCTIVSLEDNTNSYMFLYQNKPNPATDITAIDFVIPKAGYVTFEFTDVLGKQVLAPVTSLYGEGINTLQVNCKALQAGIYYYTMSTDAGKLTQKMLIVK